MTVSADARALDEGHLSQIPQSAAELISAGAQLLQIRTEKQLLIAVQRPRDEERFKTKLETEASSAGEDFFYSIPYKDHVQGCQDRRRCSCPSTNVEGPGVGLARSAVRLWGNCSIEVTLDQDTADAWLVRATFTDFETNYTRFDTKRVSKMKPTKGGRMMRASDRDLDVVYQQGASKVERDTILRALPKHIIDRCFELAKYAATLDKMPIKDQLARILRRFTEIDVTLSQIETYLGCALDEKSIRAAEKDPREVCAQLRGMITAIKGGELDATEVFGVKAEVRVVTPAESSPSAVSLADLAGEESDADAWAKFLLVVSAARASFNGERPFIVQKPKDSGQWFTDDVLWTLDHRLYDEIGRKLTVDRDVLAQRVAQVQGTMGGELELGGPA